MRIGTHGFVDVTCPTCGAKPRERCEALKGFGGAHASRIREALPVHRCDDTCRDFRPDSTTPRRRSTT